MCEEVGVCEGEGLVGVRGGWCVCEGGGLCV